MCVSQVKKCAVNLCMCVSLCVHLFVYPWYVGWMDVLMIIFLWRKGETEMETDRERTVAGWLPYLGGWWEDEGPSRKDILSGHVRVLSALAHMSLVTHLTRKHTLLTVSHITLPFRSTSVSHQWPNSDRNWETLGCLSSVRTVASDRGKQGHRSHNLRSKPDFYNLVAHDWIHHG